MNGVQFYKVVSEVLQGDFPYYYKYVGKFFPFPLVCTADSAGEGKQGVKRSRPCSLLAIRLHRQQTPEVTCGSLCGELP